MRSLKPGWIILAASFLVVAACANQKGTAEKAIAQIESAVATVREEAAKFAPDALHRVDSTLTSLKDQLAKGDYQAVLAGAPQLTAAVGSLKETVAAKKAEFETQVAAALEKWNSLSADVPKMVDAIQSRMDILGKSKKLPKNVSQEAYDAAKSGFESMKTTWDQAKTAFSSGDAVDAVTKASSVQQTGAEVLQKLGMTTS